jgi:thiamine biosynthesis lipoprotein
MAERKVAAAPDDQRVPHWTLSRRAMACEFTVCLPPVVAYPMGIGGAALDEIGRMEDLLSIYRGDSELTRINRTAGQRATRTDQRVFKLLELSARLHQRTKGAFDPASGALIRAWGFFIGPKRVPEPAELAEALGRCGMQHVELDAAESKVRYRISGLEINPGSIGKGYAIDRALTLIRRDFGVECALMQGGRSSVVAFGSPAGDDRGWLVGIQNPYDPARRLATVRLRDRALGTSGVANQYFEAGGRRYGHVLDPRTGRPAWCEGGPQALASASVLAADGATADGLATALFVMGLDKAAGFCHNHPNIAALLVLPAGPGGSNPVPRVLTFNLPPEDVDLRPGADLPRDVSV